jgi:TRAP-type mannitol/chloroaromatic compound transport system substrate-binding protein
MDRREFLTIGGAAAAATAAGSTVAAPDSAQPMPYLGKNLRELRLAMPWSDGFAGPADQALRLARDVAERSDGRIRLQPSFEVGEPLAAVARGGADLFFASAHDQTAMHSGFAFFGGLPGEQGLPPDDLRAWIDLGGGEGLWDGFAAEFGFKPLLAGHTGPHSLFLANATIESMGALAGRKVVVGGLGADVARGLGLAPEHVPPSRVATLLADATILGAECGGAIASYALGLPPVAPYWAGASISPFGAAISLGVRRTLWEQMSRADQDVFRAAAAAEFARSVAEEEAHRTLVHPTPPADRVWPIAAELIHAVRRIADAVVAHAAGSDDATRRIGMSYAAFRRLAGASVPAVPTA